MKHKSLLLLSAVLCNILFWLPACPSSEFGDSQNAGNDYDPNPNIDNSFSREDLIGTWRGYERAEGASCEYVYILERSGAFEYYYYRNGDLAGQVAGTWTWELCAWSDGTLFFDLGDSGASFQDVDFVTTDAAIWCDYAVNEERHEVIYYRD